MSFGQAASEPTELRMPKSWPTSGGTEASTAAPSCQLKSEREIVWHGTSWHMDKLLGSGRFASVFLLRSTTPTPANDGTPASGVAAAKVTKLQGLSAWARAQLAEEAIIWSSLSHRMLQRTQTSVTHPAPPQPLPNPVPAPCSAHPALLRHGGR